ncbi:hypothetical protein AB0N24_23000 [Arthrobacter sp. NPDC093128]|uniref:hypothetical protein n=1 Tax=Arthrobacter sp. NPDC093128 TaxID=3154979 RepID=UPI00341CAEF3
MSKDHKKKGITGNVLYGNGMQNVVTGTNYAVMGTGNIYASGNNSVPPALQANLDQLRSAIEELRLTASERTYAQEQLKSVQAALSAASPDKKKAAEHLRGFTATIKEAGELATAGSAVASAIGNIAAWLGPVGVSILALL